MEPARSPFRHEALLFGGVDEFVRDTSAFVREGLEAEEAVLVSVVAEHAEPLRAELGSDAADIEFVPVEEVARNPARIVPAWQSWVDRNMARGTKFRGVSEPLWGDRTELEFRECGTSEHLLNTAFGAGPDWLLLCPYDSTLLPEPVLAGVSASHRVVRGGPASHGAMEFDAEGARDALRNEAPQLGPPLFESSFGLDGLRSLRTAIEHCAERLGLRARRLADFVLVADELACNSVRHGGGEGTLRLWADGRQAICEVRDQGLIEDPLVGRRRPDLRSAAGGAGLWTVNQLCDLVLINSAIGSGTSVRAYMSTT